MTFYRENSAVLQTIRACLPKVNGWENPSVRLLLIAGHKAKWPERGQTYSNSDLRVNKNW